MPQNCLLPNKSTRCLQSPCHNTIKKGAPSIPAQPGASSCASSTSKAGWVLRSPDNHVEKTWCSQHTLQISPMGNPVVRLSNKVITRRETTTSMSKFCPRQFLQLLRKNSHTSKGKKNIIVERGRKFPPLGFFFSHIYQHTESGKRQLQEDLLKFHFTLWTSKLK